MIQHSIRRLRGAPQAIVLCTALAAASAGPAGAQQRPEGAAPGALRLQELVAEAPQLAQGVPGDAAASAAAPALAVLVDEALKNNPELLAAAKEAEAGEERVRPAGALEDPMLEAGLLNAPIQPFSLRSEDMTMKMLGLSQKLPYPGKRALREQVAAKDAETLKYGLRETRNRVVRDVKLAYLDLSLTDATIRQLRNNREVLNQFLRIAESRYTVGQAAQADVFRAQTQLSRMNEELLRMQRERPVTEAELERLLGRRGDAAPIAAALPGVGAERFDLEALRQEALRDRPQLLGLQSAVERGSKAVDLARSERHPDFDVRFSYGQRDKNPLGEPRQDVFSLTVAMNLPVWRKDKIEPRIAEAEAMREQSLDLLRSQENEVAAKLRQQTAIAEQSRKSVQLYETSILPQARLAVQAALAAYRVSRVDLLTLLDSQMMLYGYDIGRARERVNFNKALAEIEFLTGRPVH